jgi:hypothetical protein
MIEQPRGQYRIIRVDGIETIVPEKPTIRAICKAIGCVVLDTVTLSRDGPVASVIMLMDDTGMIDGKPVNESATAIARGAFGPQYAHSIHGDVAIANDGDFDT